MIPIARCTLYDINCRCCWRNISFKFFFFTLLSVLLCNDFFMTINSRKLSYTLSMRKVKCVDRISLLQPACMRQVKAVEKCVNLMEFMSPLKHDQNFDFRDLFQERLNSHKIEFIKMIFVSFFLISMRSNINFLPPLLLIHLVAYSATYSILYICEK